METDAKMLGQLAHSMLLGEQGNQRKEVRQLCKWLLAINPKLVIFSNILIGGCIGHLKQKSDIPVLVTLQGDDVFLESLQEPYKTKCIDQIKKIAEHVDGFIVQSNFFRDYMAEYFSIPLDKFYVTPLGINTSDFESFQRKIAGWLAPEHRAYAQQQLERLKVAGHENHFEYLGAVEREAKLEFLKNIDVFSVPTQFKEPKGLYVLGRRINGRCSSTSRKPKTVSRCDLAFTGRSRIAQ